MEKSEKMLGVDRYPEPGLCLGLLTVAFFFLPVTHVSIRMDKQPAPYQSKGMHPGSTRRREIIRVRQGNLIYYDILIIH